MGSEEFGGDHLVFRRTKAASVVTEGLKGGEILKILEGFTGGHSNLLGQYQTWGGSRKLSIVMRGGGITSVK